MPFHKTYEEFLNQMEAVKRVKEVIDDDYFIETVMPVAYKCTIERLRDGKYSDAEMQRQWDRLSMYNPFDLHFEWMRASRLLRGDRDTYFGMFSSLKQACLGNNIERNVRSVMKIWTLNHPEVYT